MSMVVSGQRYLRDCAVCGGAIVAKSHQADSARACQPSCAKRLAVQEHPEIDKVRARDGLDGSFD
jgi:hypothetical protein